jgi:hypothetical protein
MSSSDSTKTPPAPSSSVPLLLAGDLTNVPTQTLRRRSVLNLMKMGHCAPTVMQTLLDASGTEAEWLIKLTAGLPGGIGNTGGECGGVTAPLILIGLRHAREPMHDGLPPVFEKGHDLLRRFAGCHGTTLCREIRGTDRLPLRCVGAVRQAPELCVQTLSSECDDAIPAATRGEYRRLYGHFVEQKFHCAHAVMQQVRHLDPVNQDVLDGDAFANDLNKFNRVMNLGYQLAGWFRRAFGSTQCRDLTGCDFSTRAGVNSYVETDGVSRCQAMAQQVAVEVDRMIRVKEVVR